MWSPKALEKKAQLETLITKVLVDGEAVLGVVAGRRMGVPIDFIVATNARLLAINSLMIDFEGGRDWAPWSKIASVDAKSKGLSAYQITCHLADGTKKNLGKITEKDVADLFLDIVKACVDRPPRPELEIAVANTPAPQSVFEVARTAPEAVAVDEVFGMRRIRITQDGRVHVGLTALPGKGHETEELLAVSLDSTVTKKTGLGRAAAAVATGGLNLLGPNVRGDIYLTITTDRTVHTLKADAGAMFAGQSEILRAQRILAAGQSVLSRLAATPTIASDPNTTASSDDAATRLRRLDDLLAEGLINYDEHTLRRAAIIESL